MRAIFKKEVLIGTIISIIIFSLCYHLASPGGGPCNAGIGVIEDFFILFAVLIIAGICLVLPSPRISLIAQTVLVLTFIALIILFILLKFF